MPGPNVCNLALMFGDRHFGWRGAFTALAGLLALPLLLLLSLGTLLGQLPEQAAIAGGLRGMGAVAAGLVAGSALKLLLGLKQHPQGLPLVLVLAIAAEKVVMICTPAGRPSGVRPMGATVDGSRKQPE